MRKKYSGMLLIEDVCNWEDVDPLSLENVCELAVVWEYRRNGRRYWYDAVEWLRWICTVADNQPRKHPLFGVRLGLVHHQAIYDACVSAGVRGIEKELAQCEDKGLQLRRIHDQFGQLLQAVVHARSPLLQARVPSVRTVYTEGDLGCAVDCTATFTAVLFNCREEPVETRTVYM